MFDHWSHRSFPQEIHGGFGVLDDLGELLKLFGARRVMLVTNPWSAAAPKGEMVKSQLGRLMCGSFEESESYLDAHTAQRAMLAFRSCEADALVSFGGGSVTDTAKAISFFSEMEAGMSGRSVADRPMLPHIAVPTTLTGAPYTGEFSIVDPHTRRSSSAGSPTSTPIAVLVELSVQAGIDQSQLMMRAVVALAHAIDVIGSTHATPEARMLAHQGLSELVTLLPALRANPQELELVGKIIDAAVVCGRARQNAPAGFHHTLVQLLGARTKAPYRFISSALLPYTTAFISDVLPGPTFELLNTLFEHEPSELGSRVQWWLEDLGLTHVLFDFDVDEEDIEAVARQAASQRGVQQAPRPAGEGDIYALLNEALG